MTTETHIYLLKEIYHVNNTATADDNANNINKKIIFKNCAPFTRFVSRINNTYIDNAQDINIIMPMYNFTECRNR